MKPDKLKIQLYPNGISDMYIDGTHDDSKFSTIHTISNISTQNPKNSLISSL